MKRKYFESLNKIEFAVTNLCTGHCKHCSQGEHPARGVMLDPERSAQTVKAVASEYKIETVMAFGGEPLLHPEGVYAVLGCASELGIPRRQLITSGYFSREKNEISRVARSLSSCGVNDLLLSVDAFHQETIPLEPVRKFAEEAKKQGIFLRLQPAWLLSCEHKNPYNEKTREILNSFRDLEILEGEGNVIFFEGNALKFLSEYLPEKLPENPYREDPHHIKCLSVSADGQVLSGNIYQNDIMEIMASYEP